MLPTLRSNNTNQIPKQGPGSRVKFTCICLMSQNNILGRYYTILTRIYLDFSVSSREVNGVENLFARLIVIDGQECEILYCLLYGNIASDALHVILFADLMGYVVLSSCCESSYAKLMFRG